MKVLQINSVCGYGSTGRIATDLDGFLRAAGHESLIVYGRGRYAGPSKAVRIGSDLDVYAHVAWTRFLDRHGFASRGATRALVRQIETFAPDVVHLHNIHGYYLHLPTLFSYLRNAGRRVVWTLHDCWPFTGHCAYFEAVGCDRWLTGCFACPQKRRYPASYLRDASAQNYADKKRLFGALRDLTIVTPSQWLARLVARSYLRDYPVRMIHNGIDTGIFSPQKSDFRAKYELGDQFVLLGVAGTWDERKGLRTFLELADALAGYAKIVLVGLSGRQLRDLPPGITGLGKIGDVHELAQIYSAADLFLNPTEEDNFPTVNLEAMACGTPVITFDAGGSPECVDVESGAVVRKGDVAGLLGAIEKYRASGKEKWSRAAVSRAREYFDKNRKFQEYLALYGSRDSA